MDLIFVTAALSLPTPDRVIKDTEELSRKDAPKNLVSGEKIKIWPTFKCAKESKLDDTSPAYMALEAYSKLGTLRTSVNSWLNTICFSTPIAKCCPSTRKKDIEQEIEVYKKVFEDHKRCFIRNFEPLVEWWARTVELQYGNSWGELVRKYKLSREALTKSMQFDVLTYSVSSQDGGLKAIEDNISDYMYEGLVSYVQKFFANKTLDSNSLVAPTVTFENELDAYLESYAFLDPQLLEIRTTVKNLFGEMWLHQINNTTKKSIEMDKGCSLWKIKSMLGSPAAIEALKASAKPVKVSFARPSLTVKMPNVDEQKCPVDSSPTQVETKPQPSPSNSMNEALNRLRNQCNQ